jgi:small-conductance mechanosensitive channel
MVGLAVGGIPNSFAVIFWSLGAAQLALSPTDLGLRAGLTLIILLIALLLGPRISRSVSRVPALIETARVRRATRNGASITSDSSNGTPSSGAPDSVELADRPTGMSRWLGGVVLVCLWIFALYLIAIVWLVDTPVVALNSESLLHVVHDFMVNLGITMLITVLTLVVARALQKSLMGSLRRGHVNSNLVVLVGRTAFVATVVVGIILVLGVWGLGIALPMTVALTLALQDILKNVVSGMYLLVERPFVIGDQITIANYTGVVESIYIRVTALRTTGGERVLVPNGLLFSSPVVNNSFSQRRRVGLLVTVPDSGPDATATAQKQVLLALEDVETALRTPAPEVALSKVSGGKVDLRAVFWLPVTRGEDNGDTLSDAMRQVRTRLPDAEVAPLDPTLAD